MARYANIDEVLHNVPVDDMGNVDFITLEKTLIKCTADVVPKSEYDRLEKLFNDMTQEAKRYLNRLYGIRAEVAREIFAEIDRERMISRACERRGITYTIPYAELKKKYTGGENERD